MDKEKRYYMGTLKPTGRIDRILELADKLPSGSYDYRAVDKLRAEYEEFKAALSSGNDSETWAEAADVVYYAVKTIALVAWTCDIPIDIALKVCIAKYELRSRTGNPKVPELEMEAVSAIVTAFQAKLPPK